MNETGEEKKTPRKYIPKSLIIISARCVNKNLTFISWLQICSQFSIIMNFAHKQTHTHKRCGMNASFQLNAWY